MQRRVLWLAVASAGGALALLGCAGGLAALAWPLAEGLSLTATVTLPAAGIVALGLGLGLPLVLHAWGGWQARPSRPFNPPPVRWVWFAWVLLVGLGALVSSLSLAPAIWLPPIHVLTMALPPLMVLCLVGRALGGVGGSWREVVAGMAGGGALGLGIALIGEALIAFAFVVAATAVMLATPGGAEQIASVVKKLQDPTWVTDLDNLLPFLRSPAVAVSALFLFTVPVPLVEEASKTLAGGVVARWIRPRPARAFLWGVAGGAGFSLTENLFNGALGGAEGWVLGAVARFGATVMHCATSGLVGWGWGQLWTGRRPRRLLGSYAAGVIIHGLWNAAAVGAVLLSISSLTHEGDALRLALAGFGTLIFLALLALLTGVSVVALQGAGRRLAAEAAASYSHASSGEAGRCARLMCR